MKSYGYFYMLNHIAMAVDAPNKDVGFKAMVELDMFNRASIFTRPDAEPRAAQLVKDLTAAIYPVGDCRPTIEQRMMLVQALHDQELEKIVGSIRFFVPFAYTKEELCDTFGFFDNGDTLSIPYFLRHHFMDDQAVFCEGKLTSFAYSCSHGEVSKTARQYGLFPAYAYGKNDIPEQFKHLPLF